MNINSVIIRFSLLSIIGLFSAAFVPVSGENSPQQAVVWVIFRDKQGGSGGSAVSSASLARRRRSGYHGIGHGDAAIPPGYIDAVRTRGGRCRQVINWINAASFTIPAANLSSVSELPFVKALVPVSRFTRMPGGVVPRPLRKSTVTDISAYGMSFWQMDFVGIPHAHTLIKHRLGSVPGTGVIIGIFDTGFFLDHVCFDYVKENGGVIGDSDFVDHDGDVADRDRDGDSHGTRTLSLVGGYDPPAFIGAAWGARFLLARTENDFTESHIEEDAWIAALHWAESRGADIISSSLGYRDGFVDTAYLDNDTVVDYEYDHLDGRSTIISMAVDSAVSRGVIIVNSMGNEARNYDLYGFTPDFGTLTAPSDVDGIIAVGAVDDDGSISSFSSLGPTADGRIKPDVVALGTGIFVPIPGTRTGYTYSSGTSFSTPVVAGICALIRQCDPSLDAPGTRKRLLMSCRLSAFQDSVDNVYGWGIPDALAACLGRDEILVEVTGKEGGAIGNVDLYVNEQDVPGVRTDRDGVAVAAVDTTKIQTGLRAVTAGGLARTVTAQGARSAVHIVFDNRIVIGAQDSTGNAVAGGQVWWRDAVSGDSASTSLQVTGFTGVPFYSRNSCVLVVHAPGYYSSDTLTVDSGEDPCTLGIVLQSIGVEKFVLAPNVVFPGRRGDAINVFFTAGGDDRGQNDQHVYLVIRSIHGSMVWSHTERLEEYKPFSCRISCTTRDGKAFTPGTYFLTLHYAGKKYIRKFLVAG